MNKTIVLGHENSFYKAESFENSRGFRFFDKEEDAFYYHIENPEVDSYILDAEDLDPEVADRCIRYIHYLNPLVKVLIKENLEKKFQSLRDGVLVYDSFEELGKYLNSLPQDKRKTHRALWPVKVNLWNPGEPNKFKSGIILSISSGGCFIRSPEILDYNGLLCMNIKFKDFNFMTEGRVKRRDNSQKTDGIGVEFVNISPRTKEYIGEIINEKLLNEIMKKININEEGDLN